MLDVCGIVRGSVSVFVYAYVFGGCDGGATANTDATNQIRLNFGTRVACATSVSVKSHFEHTFYILCIPPTLQYTATQASHPDARMP